MDFDRLESAVGKGLDKVAGSSVEENDPLQAYNLLKPHDFADLVSKFGEPAVMDYIKTMEIKRIQKG